MANAIKIKRSAGEIGSNTAAAGELMWVDGGTSGGSTGALYIGDMTGSGSNPATIKIGGPSFETDILTNSTFTGITKVDAPTYANGYVADDKVTDTKFVLDAIADSGVPINAASDTLIPDTGANAAAVATGSALVYNGTVWQNRALTGHVAMDGAGDTVVSGFATGQLDLADATTSSYVSTVVGTANEISVKISGVEATVGSHTATSALTLGFTDNTVIPGNLTVNGTTTTVDTATVSLSDSMFVIGTAGAAVDALDRGIEFKTGTSETAESGYFGWDRDGTLTGSSNTGCFTMTTGATGANVGQNTFQGTLGDAKFGLIDATISSDAAAQPNITSVGTLTGASEWNATAIANQYGGTGQNSAAWLGMPYVTNGVWDVETYTDESRGGTGMDATSLGAGTIMVGTAAAGLTTLTTSGAAAGDKLALKSDGTIEWSNVVDGGVFS